MEQGSDEWYAARLGKVTASRAADVLTKKAVQHDLICLLNLS